MKETPPAGAWRGLIGGSNGSNGRRSKQKTQTQRKRFRCLGWDRPSDELRTADLEMAAFVSVTAIEALAHTAVLNRPKALPDDTVRTLIDETMSDPRAMPVAAYVTEVMQLLEAKTIPQARCWSSAIAGGALPNGKGAMRRFSRP
jgi:hypothetical protein